MKHEVGSVVVTQVVQGQNSYKIYNRIQFNNQVNFGPALKHTRCCIQIDCNWNSNAYFPTSSDNGNDRNTRHQHVIVVIAARMNTNNNTTTTSITTQHMIKNMERLLFACATYEINKPNHNSNTRHQHQKSNNNSIKLKTSMTHQKHFLSKWGVD